MKTGLFLFDIDGTLSTTGGLHIQGWGNALVKVASFYNVYVPLDSVLNSTRRRIGLAEITMAKELLAEFGLKYTEDKINETVQIFRTQLNEIICSSSIPVLSGALDFLRDLRNKHQYTGVVTGNSSAYGRKTLEKAGLLEYLDILAFSDNLRTKPEIAQHAVELSMERGINYAFTVSIGDNCVDIEGGNAIGSFTVGVLTGTHNLEQLTNVGAKLVIPDLTHYSKIYEQLRIENIC